MRTAIISVHPRFAEQLITGSKSSELRRRACTLAPGDRLYIYSSSPRMAVVGEVRVVQSTVMPLSLLWSTRHDQAGVTRAEFDAYFDGLEEGTVIDVTSPLTFPAVDLRTLRQLWPRFHPPQTLRFLKPDEAASLVAHRQAADALRAA